MRYFVTGASGFVGRSLVRRLADEGDEVVAYLRDSSELPTDLRDRVQIERGSLGDPNRIAVAAKNAEVAIHAAAVRSDQSDKLALDWVNVAGTENVVNAVRRAGCRRLVHISCADVTLFNGDRTNWNEDRELDRAPLGHHARTKQVAEEIALTSSTRDFEVCAIRPSLVWGPDSSSTIADLSLESAGIQLIGKGKNLFGAVYIHNLVDAILSASEVNEAAGQRYYVADGDFIDSREFFTAVSTAIGLAPPRTGPSLSVALAKAKVGKGGLSPAEIVRRGRGSLFDTQNARKDLDWEPSVSLAEGMLALSAWAKKIGGLVNVRALATPPASAESIQDMVTLAAKSRTLSEK